MKVGDNPTPINGLHAVDVKIRVVPKSDPEISSVGYALAHITRGPDGAVEGCSTQGKIVVEFFDWSTRTKELLKDLMDSIEQDLLPRHFGGTHSQENENDSDGLGTRNEEETPQL